MGEKRSLGRGSAPILDDNTPISNRYLTFETVLPSPVLTQQPGSSGSGNQKLPKCPDLKPYTSPMAWSPSRKAVTLFLSCCSTLASAYTASAYSPPAKAISKDFHASHEATLVGITTFCLGFGVAPMALAPLSEVFGRKPVFVVSGFIFLIFQITSALVRTLPAMLIARFMVGVGSSVFSAIVGGVISDVWAKKDRNQALALFSCSAFLGTELGALIAGIIMNQIEDDTVAWRWTFWHQAIFEGAVLLALIAFFKESRASVLLTRKAKVLNDWYEQLEKAGVYGVWTNDASEASGGSTASSSATKLALPSDQLENGDGEKDEAGMRLQRIRWIVKEDEQRPPLRTMISISIRRPFRLLFHEPVVFCFSMWAAFCWGVLYLSFAVVPYLYGLDINMSSRVYIAIIVAVIIAAIVAMNQERLLEHPQWKKRAEGDSTPYSPSKFWAFMRKNFPAEAPEARLYFVCILSMTLPAGLFGAFMAPAYMDGYSRAVGLGFANWGIYVVYLASFNYITDAYQIYASSGLAALGFCRNVVGGAFPVITGMMFRNLGIKGAGGLLGAIALVLTLVPWVLVLFGAKLRARSSFAISLQQE